MDVYAKDTGKIRVHEGRRTIKEAGGLTIVHPFYNEKERYRLHEKIWKTWAGILDKDVRVVIIDDCSPSPVHTWIKHPPAVNLDVYRITTDLRWNTPGALNLGVTVAPTEWVCTMDSDCAFEDSELAKVLFLNPLDDYLYKFQRERLYGDRREPYRYLPCTILMNKNVFFNHNGFDEDFTGQNSGGYGFFDNDFDYRVGQWGQVKGVKAIEWMPPLITEIAQRNHDAHHRINKKIMYGKWKGTIPQNKRILNFNWEKTYEHRL